MTTYHCHQTNCTFATRSFANMAKHTRKEHPSLLKRRRTSSKEARVSTNNENSKYCPNCGNKL